MRAQLMLFSGLASMDGWDTGFVPWNSSKVEPDSEAMFSKYTRERAKLVTFLYSAYRRQGQTGIPVARALMVDYDNDTEAFTIEDQFLLGDELMVAPVSRQDYMNATSRQVHFPPGHDWVDYWEPSSKPYLGGSTVEVQAPLTTLPLFQRLGSVIPMVNPKDNRTLTLRTHESGSAHTAMIYDDDGISTDAVLSGSYFQMEASTTFADFSSEFTVRVDHARWPTWEMIH